MRIFVDLDGVLADFDAGAEAVFGMSPREFEQLHGVPLFWKRLADWPGFYDRLPWTRQGKLLWQFVLALTEGGPPPRILTGLPLGDWAEPQKRVWCARELGEQIPVICCRSIDKHKFCVAGDVLIDDRLQNGLDWTTAGGIFIHHIETATTIAELQKLFDWLKPARPEEESKMDDREDAATEKRIADMDAEIQHGVNIARTGFVDVRELAAIVYEADRRLQMAAGEPARPHWRDAEEADRDTCESQVRTFLDDGTTPAPASSLDLARVQLLVGIVSSLRDFTRR